MENDNELHAQLHQQAAAHTDNLAEAATDPENRLFYRKVAADIRGHSTTYYLGIAGIGAWFAVSAKTVTKWLTRYDDYPAPDVIIGSGHRETPGWSPDREPEWRDWYAARPGHGWRKRES